MEWIRISPNKLKIMLTAEDARHYELDCEAADYTDLVTRSAFRDILSDVKKETGFDASEDKIYIQMYPSKEGGCELFVTKIGLLLHEEEAHAPPSGKKGKRSARAAERRRAFRFEELEPMLSLCRRLKTAPHVFESSALRDERGAWWLLLSGTGGDALGFAREYGKEVREDLAALYLAEHAHTVCRKKAIETLAGL